MMAYLAAAAFGHRFCLFERSFIDHVSYDKGRWFVIPATTKGGAISTTRQFLSFGDMNVCSIMVRLVGVLGLYLPLTPPKGVVSATDSFVSAKTKQKPMKLHAWSKSKRTAYNSKHITALENVGTGILHCKWWSLQYPPPSGRGASRYTFTWMCCIPLCYSLKTWRRKGEGMIELADPM